MTIFTLELRFFTYIFSLKHLPECQIKKKKAGLKTHAVKQMSFPASYESQIRTDRKTI